MPIQVTGLALEPRASLLAAASLIRRHPRVDVWWATCAPAGDQTGKVVGHGGDGCGRAKAGSAAPIGGAQGPLTGPQSGRSQAQGVGGAVDDRTGPTCAPGAPAHRVVGAPTTPRRAGCFGLPPAQVQADLRHEGWRGEAREAIEAGPVDAADAGPWGVPSTCGLVAPGVLGPTRGGGQRGGGDRERAVTGGEVCCPPSVARGKLLLVTGVECP